MRVLIDSPKTAIINILSCVALALLVEFMIYLGLQHPSRVPGFLLEYFKAYYRTSDRCIVQMTDCAQFDPELFYTLRPGHCTFRNREFTSDYDINSKGVRDDEKSLTNPEIIVLGDSYSMGWGVQQDESFPQQLEKLSSKKVLNAAISSFGTAREFILLKRFSLDSVKYIVIQYHANDSEENFHFVRNNHSLDTRPEFSYDSLRKQITKREQYFPFKHLYGISKTVGRALLITPKKRPQVNDEAQNFLRVIAHANIPRHIQIITFTLDDYKNLRDEFINGVDSLLKTNEFKTLNIKTLKIRNDLMPEDYFILDEHLNANGHRKIALKIHHQFFTD